MSTRSIIAATNNGEYNGPGCFFTNSATVRRGRFHTLVMQRCGYDICGYDI